MLTLPLMLDNKQCGAHTYTCQQQPSYPVWGFFFFNHSRVEEIAKKQKKESMNISLSGNSGSGGSQQEFWLATDDLLSVGTEPGGCLESRAGNLLRTSSSPSYPQRRVHFHSWGRGHEENGGGKRTSPVSARHKEERDSEEKVQDGSNPLSNSVLPAAETCITSRRGFKAQTSQSQEIKV